MRLGDRREGCRVTGKVRPSRGSLPVLPRCAQSVARPEKRILNLLALGIIP